MLEETLQVEFNVEVEDGSPLEIAQQLIDIYKQCLSGTWCVLAPFYSAGRVFVARYMSHKPLRR